MRDWHFKKMRERTDVELDLTIEEAINEAQKSGLDFYKICAGVEAYDEKRSRKEGLITRERLTKLETELTSISKKVFQ